MNQLDVFQGLGNIVLSILKGVVPLVFLFMLFQVFFLKFPWKYVIQLLTGVLIASIGLVLFLQGVQIGFLPVGEYIGEVFGSFNQKWVMILLGFGLGFLAAMSEPSIRVLASQVEESTSGYIRKSVVIFTISIGVAISVGLGMIKVVFGIPLWYMIIPGYILALLMIWFSDASLIPVAFDAGGVATGPMTAIFLTAISTGVAGVIEGRNPITDGLGMVGLMVMAPVLSMSVLGLLYKLNQRRETK